MRIVGVGIVIATALCALTTAQERHGTAPAATAPTVLFMCPHGAAKSVLASAYFQRAARERGLTVHVDAVGTEPDETVSPVVAKHLAAQGYDVPIPRPRAVTPKDLEVADVVVSMGCDVSRLELKPGSLRRWDEVPGPSESVKDAGDAIRRRVLALVDELVARRR